MKNNILLFCLLCISLFACDEVTDNGNGQTDPSTLTTPVNQPGPSSAKQVPLNPQALEKDGQVVSCQSINKKIADAADAKWVSSPFQIALQFAGDEMDCRKKSIVAESTTGGETRDKLIVTVEEEGLMDDSVAGSLLIMRMERKGDAWEVLKATRVWKCWQGRGHVGYNSEPCS